MQHFQRSPLAAIFAALFAPATNIVNSGRPTLPYTMGERHPRQGMNSHYRKSGPGRSHRQGKTKPAAVRMKKKLRSCGV